MPRPSAGRAARAAPARDRGRARRRTRERRRLRQQAGLADLPDPHDRGLRRDRRLARRRHQPQVPMVFHTYAHIMPRPAPVGAGQGTVAATGDDGVRHPRGDWLAVSSALMDRLADLLAAADRGPAGRRPGLRAAPRRFAPDPDRRRRSDRNRIVGRLPERDPPDPWRLHEAGGGVARAARRDPRLNRKRPATRGSGAASSGPQRRPQHARVVAERDLARSRRRSFSSCSVLEHAAHVAIVVDRPVAPTPSMSVPRPT